MTKKCEPFRICSRQTSGVILPILTIISTQWIGIQDGDFTGSVYEEFNSRYVQSVEEGTKKTQDKCSDQRLRGLPQLH